MKNGKVNTPKVLVCQHGSRHRYAIPRMLEEEGMLAALFTDSSAESIMGRFSSMLGEKAPAKLKRLSHRKITGVPSDKINSYDYPLLMTMLKPSTESKRSALHADKEYGDHLSKKLIPLGTQGADVIYSMNRSNLEFIEHVKAQGCKSVIDIFISPMTERVVVEECKKMPEWGSKGLDAEFELGIELWKKTAAIGDLLLCPSEWVAEGIRSVAPDAADKIRIVPYGCSIDYGGRVNSPVKGRVLFAGGDALRKGLHYLAEAATLLKQDVPELDVRIAGSLPEEVTGHPLVKDLNFLGKLNLQQMQEEYLSADLFVLPSLSEGFAGVVAEAIGAGCPVVVTKESGSPIVDGREGLIVESRDSEQLAGAMQRLIEDREFRSKCSEACLEQVPFYNENSWKERLINVINALD